MDGQAGHLSGMGGDALRGSVSSDFDARYRLAEAHGEAGRWTEAATVYRELLAENPAHAWANHNMGVAAVGLGVPQLGLPYFETALAVKPDCAQFWISYVSALQRSGRSSEAAAMYQRACQHGLAGEEADRLAAQIGVSTIQTVPADSDRAAEAPPARDHAALERERKVPEARAVDEILQAFGRRDFSLATDLASALTREFPQFDFGWKALGAGLQSLGRLSEAIEPMRRAVALAPADPEAHYNLAVALQSQDRLLEAEASLRRALQRDPNYVDASINLATVLHGLGRPREGANIVRTVLSRHPLSVPALRNLGLICQDLDEWDEAERCFRKVLEIMPGLAQAFVDLATLQKKRDRYSEAEAACREAIRLEPGKAAHQTLLGQILLESGQDDAADDVLQQALQLDRGRAAALEAFARSYRETNKPDKALACLDRAIALEPNDPEHHVNRGVVLKELGRNSEAESCFRRALDLEPQHAQAHFNLGVVHQEVGRQEEAIACYRKAISLSSHFPKAQVNFGLVLMNLARHEEAQACFKQAIASDPKCEMAYVSLCASLWECREHQESLAYLYTGLEHCPDSEVLLANIAGECADLGRSEEALATCEKLLKLNPENVAAFICRADAQRYLGRIEEAETALSAALELQPSDTYALSGVLFRLSEMPTISPQELFARHRQVGEAIEAKFVGSMPSHSNPKDPDRQLRIGFVSADLRNHTVAFLARDVLIELSRFPGLSLHAFYNHAREDETTALIRQAIPNWHRIVGTSDQHVFDLIRRNEIDVLIDLSGHTEGHRLNVFARRPAPIQASWIGYPATTGMTTMDYYIGDRFFVPNESYSSQFTEALVHLPASVPFGPYKFAPPVNSLPAIGNGYITFGSFNRMGKISPQVVDLWCRLMNQVKDSRLILAGMLSGESARALMARFAQYGFGRERVLPLPRLSQDEYQALHHKVDIALDTFPYAGGTTTLHALWMGVPTLTLDCGKAVSRQGAFGLGHAGLGEFVARDEADFIERGRRLTADPQYLASLRAGLRQRLSASALTHPAVVASGLNQAVRIMWTRWCQGLPAAFIAADGAADPGQ